MTQTTSPAPQTYTITELAHAWGVARNMVRAAAERAESIHFGLAENGSSEDRIIDHVDGDEMWLTVAGENAVRQTLFGFHKPPMNSFDKTQTAGKPIAWITVETLNSLTWVWEVVKRETADPTLTADDLDIKAAKRVAELAGAAPGTPTRATLRNSDNRLVAVLDSRDFLDDFIL